MDLATLAFLFAVGSFVLTKTEDGLATVLAILLTYLIFACRLPRAVLIRLLRDMQGCD
jgi:hypothetical protein